MMIFILVLIYIYILVISPLQDDEVRGVEKLSGYAHNLFNPLKE